MKEVKSKRTANPVEQKLKALAFRRSSMTRGRRSRLFAVMEPTIASDSDRSRSVKPPIIRRPDSGVSSRFQIAVSGKTTGMSYPLAFHQAPARKHLASRSRARLLWRTFGAQVSFCIVFRRTSPPARAVPDLQPWVFPMLDSCGAPSVLRFLFALSCDGQVRRLGLNLASGPSFAAFVNVARYVNEGLNPGLLLLGLVKLHQANNCHSF